MTMEDEHYADLFDPVAGTMSRADALTMAWEMSEKLSAAPVKSNGYPVDGWKAPTLAERTDAILRLAEFLSGEK